MKMMFLQTIQAELFEFNPWNQGLIVLLVSHFEFRLRNGRDIIGLRKKKLPLWLSKAGEGNFLASYIFLLTHQMKGIADSAIQAEFTWACQPGLQKDNVEF